LEIERVFDLISCNADKPLSYYMCLTTKFQEPSEMYTIFSKIHQQI